ncbi:CPBP family intramembrane metalloprotease [Enterococcus sp. 669A]|uniref:CPBP family intramembrane metalloprotease n=1 Tax=Candidatus Enterococcus moelleringii TaxID=2815325 RepID=A0ABS3LB61_9ENTE|nr:CPBP family intramembrane glutamic endopeptidase [Enterococcus sp. 669A]MBO1306869.1 CPBP family intramembrane metalloprotease [Enterococcus sp. 669A]
MTSKQTIQLYLKISFGLMIPTAIIFILLNSIGIATSGNFLGILGLVIGGGSTAIAGIITAKRSGRVTSYATILKEFFRLKQPILAYLLVLLFLLLNFGLKLQPFSPGNFVSLFLVSILFGGIEEIGWRYMFQPTLEKDRSFFVATIVTFLAWGGWHLLYFVVDGSLFSMTPLSLLSFLIGLLGNSFILGSLFSITKSLWLCVFYHACLNAFTQVLGANSLVYSILAASISVVFACGLVYYSEMKVNKSLPE